MATQSVETTSPRQAYAYTGAFPFAAKELDTTIEDTEKVANFSLEQLSIFSQDTQRDVKATPLKPSDVLISLLKEIKQNASIRDASLQMLSSRKVENAKDEEIRLQLIQLLSSSRDQTRKQVLAMENIEDEWVIIENDNEPIDYVATGQDPTWGTRALGLAFSGGSVAWEVVKFSGKVGYRLYVETARLGTLALLGVMVVQNPLFPVMKMLAEVLLKIILK